MLDQARDVVAEHDRDGNFAETEVGSLLARGARPAQRIGGAHIADDTDAFFDAGRQHQAQPRVQRRRIALVGMFAARQIFPRHRPLGETLEHEVVDVAALGQLQGRNQPVIRCSGPGADAHRVP